MDAFDLAAGIRSAIVGTLLSGGKLIQVKELKLKVEEKAIDEAADAIAAFCNTLPTEHADMLRYRLSAEECIHFWMEHGCKNRELILRMCRQLIGPYISLECGGPAANP